VTPVLIAVGSNIDRERNLPLAFARLRRHPGIRLTAISPIYESAAAGTTTPQPAYYNAAVRIETDLAPADLKNVLLGIEAALGRVRTTDKFAPRPIDLDIALYGRLILDLNGRHIPDPDILRRPHIAVPLADLAPGWIHPEIGLTLRQIAAEQHFTEKELRQVMDAQFSLATVDSHYATDIDAGADEVYDPAFESLVQQMLVRLGEDPEREGLLRTPLRVAKALDFLTSGYHTRLEDVVHDAIFDICCEEMVIVKDIEFYSMCEHHVLPFFGRATVGYIPNGKILGLSKVARLVDMYARRLQVQERLTNQIADAMMEILNPLGAGVVIQASHFCMMMRGVEKQSSTTMTSAMRGTFREDSRTRAEFLTLIRT
jgi:GTP cyclohydrolase I